MERSLWQTFVDEQLRPRILTRRTAQLILTAGVVAVTILVWMFVPPRTVLGRVPSQSQVHKRASRVRPRREI